MKECVSEREGFPDLQRGMDEDHRFGRDRELLGAKIRIAVPQSSRTANKRARHPGILTHERTTLCINAAVDVADSGRLSSQQLVQQRDGTLHL